MASSPAEATPAEKPPDLQAGDRLTRDEFERRYESMPDVKKAELVEGVVYMPSPVKQETHGGPHAALVTWLGSYWAHTVGVEAGDNSTLRLDLDNEPQPDAFLRILPGHGGRTRTVDGYVEGGPELVSEVSASSASYDLHDKLNAYRRNGVNEYLVWRVLDGAIDWFVLRQGRYQRLDPAPGGILQSEVFSGLWLDAQAMIERDLAQVLRVLGEGIASPGHGELVSRLGHPST